jgi:hypothetical protein
VQYLCNDAVAGIFFQVWSRAVFEGYWVRALIPEKRLKPAENKLAYMKFFRATGTHILQKAGALFRLLFLKQF